MYKAEFDKLIASNKLSNNFILFGESHFYIDRYAKLLSTKDESALLVMHHDEYNFALSKAHLSSASLFGEASILMIKSEKKIPKKELELLIDLCDKNSANTFIYSYYGSDMSAYKNGIGKKSTQVVRFFHPKHPEMLQLMLQSAKEKNIRISSHALAHILEIHNQEITLALNELNKFTLYPDEISIHLIDELVSGLAEVNLEDFIKKVFLKKDSKEDLQNLIDHGEDEVRILTSITAHLVTLYMFNTYIREYGTPNAKEILGYEPPSFVVQEKASQALKIKPQTFYKIQELLLQTELKLKTTGSHKEALLHAAIMQLQKLL